MDNDNVTISKSELKQLLDTYAAAYHVKASEEERANSISVDDIMKIKDTKTRQQAILDNIGLFIKGE